MKSPLYRLQRMRFALFGVLLTVAGIAILGLAERTDSIGTLTRSLYGAEIGASLLTAGLVGILVDYHSRRDADEHRDEGLRKIFREAAPDLRDAVVDGLAVQPETLVNTVSPKTLDQIIHNCLAARLDDQELAAGLYDDLQAQVIGARNRCYDAKVSVVLTPWAKGDPTGPDSMFVATIRWEYQVVPLPSVMRFVCVSDEADYRALLRDRASTTTWLFRPTASLKASSEDSFELLQLALNGKEQRIRRTARLNSQTFTVALDHESSAKGKRSTVAYTFRTLIRREGHNFHLDIAQPTKGLHVTLFYGGCGIRRVKVLDYIASADQPAISQLSSSSANPSVSISFDGWAWPKAGVGFVWDLDSTL